MDRLNKPSEWTKTEECLDECTEVDELINKLNPDVKYTCHVL
jgi:hypothetical protein